MTANAAEPTPLLLAMLWLELGLALLGSLFLLQRVRTAPARFLGLAPAGLTASPLRFSEFFLGAACAIGGAFILQVLAAQLAQHWFPKEPGDLLGIHDLIVGAGFQLGLLAGLGYAWNWHLRPGRRIPTDFEARSPDRELGADEAVCAVSGKMFPKQEMLEFDGQWVSAAHKEDFLQRLREGVTSSTPLPSGSAPPRLSTTAALREGGLSFLTALPVVFASSFLWKGLLDLLGVDAKPQDLVSFFADTGDHLALAAMIVLAVIIAPVAEELVFRIGLFRWLRTRTLRGVALLAPAVVFAMLHGNLAALVPLVVLAVCLSLDYERTGHPLVPIVGHALFNANTLMLLLADFPV